ncbi:response regulator [Diaphorobacter aerolatus]|uniref:Response regulator n=1 Tax=Diaphorobacter aerolatus TaxID=1288495 RepID=A0A7H0GMD0_9BURK|nr:response regulator [Diaphorobacter aerolatus]QNP49446.1 response regulator [Diaphorobacter aerolatus]
MTNPSPVLHDARPAAPARVLVVEDEPKLASLMMDYLRAAGYEATWLPDGADLARHVREQQTDLVLLDVMLPGKDGISLCRELRAFSDVPVVMLTARIEEWDRLEGLEAGADDYIGKTPFSPREVVARVKAILRRTQARGERGPMTGSSHHHPSPLWVDVEAYRAYYKGALLQLTPVEFRLLRVLLSAPGHAFTRDQLLARLHADPRSVNDRAVDSHIKNLRRKFEAVDPEADPIRSVYGVGFRLELSG